MHIGLDKPMDVVLKNDLKDEYRWVLKIDRKLVRLTHMMVFSFVNSCT